MYLRFIATILLSVIGSGHFEAIKCDPLPTLQIIGVRTTLVGNTPKADRVIEGTASKDFEPLQFANVELYSEEIPRYLEDGAFQHTMNDFQGYFLLEDVPEGHYTLRFEGMGNFQIEVPPPHFWQNPYYGFTSNHGCLSWGFSMD